MLENIKKEVFKRYKKNEIRGLFFSVFHNNGNLLMSNGVFLSDKDLEELINTLFHGLIEKHKNIGKIIIDVVNDYKEIKNIEEIKNISPKEHGILLTTDNKSGIILPDTKGITNTQQAIKTIKEKNGLEGSAKITIFKTNRFVVN